jgi:hypothetical protein
MLCVLSPSACCSLRCRYPRTKVEGVAKPSRLLCLYIDALVKSCHHNAAVLMGFFEVAHLVRPPTHLFHPRMLAAVSWGWRCGCGYGRPAMAENGHVLGAGNGRQLQAPVRHVPALDPTGFLAYLPFTSSQSQGLKQMLRDAWQGLWPAAPTPAALKAE